MPNIDTITLPNVLLGSAYNEDIQASKVVGMDVERDSTSISDGGGDDLETITASEATEFTYTINSDSHDDLLIGAVSISNTTNCSVLITTDPEGQLVEPGNSTTLVIEVTPTTEDPFSFDLSIVNDSTTGENPYDITVSGVGGGGDLVDVRLLSGDVSNDTTSIKPLFTLTLEPNSNYYLELDAEVVHEASEDAVWRLDGLTEIGAEASAMWCAYRQVNNLANHIYVTGETDYDGAPSPSTATRMPVRARILVTTGGTGGDVSITFRSDTADENHTVKEGARLAVRRLEDAGGTVQVLSEDVTVESDTVPGTVFAVPLEADKVYLLEGVMGVDTPFVGVAGHEVIGALPDGAEILRCTMDTVSGRIEARVASHLGRRGPGGEIDGAVRYMRHLVVMGDTAGTVNIQLIVEDGVTSEATALAGSYLWTREITPTSRLESDQAITDDNPALNSVHSLGVEVSKNYLLRGVMAVGTTSSTVGVDFKWTDLPDDADLHSFVHNGSDATAQHANIVVRSTATANAETRIDNDSSCPDGDDVDEGEPKIVEGLLQVAAADGTLLMQLGSETTGNLTVYKNSWMLAEPCEITAVAGDNA